MNESDAVSDLLRTPEARVAYERLRKERWISWREDVTDEALRRLGARLLLEELMDRLSPDRPQAVARDAMVEERSDGQPRRGRPPGAKNKMGKRRAVCSVCGFFVPVNQDGSARVHLPPFDNKTCAGSRRAVR